MTCTELDAKVQGAGTSCWLLCKGTLIQAMILPLTEPTPLWTDSLPSKAEGKQARVHLRPVSETLVRCFHLDVLVVDHAPIKGHLYFWHVRTLVSK